MNISQQIERDGFCLVPRAVDEATIQTIINALEAAAHDNHDGVRRRGEVFAMRNVLQIAPVREILPQLKSLVAPILGERAFAVRGILFDKTLDANWKVPPHQDLTIAVREQRDAPEFRAWSQKAGVIHVQPPLEILQKMLTLRLQLDPCEETNAPLQVVRASHLWGRIDCDELTRRDKSETVSCTLPRGGALLMRPLLVHSSSAAMRPKRRRVLHLEWACEDLPHALEWHERY